MGLPLIPEHSYQYELIDRISTKLLVFYSGDDNVKGSIRLDTEQEEALWIEFVKILKMTIKN